MTSVFIVGEVIKVNGVNFTITKIEGGEISGTKQGDPKFLAGKRTIFTTYLKKYKTGEYKYDWNAK